MMARLRRIAANALIAAASTLIDLAGWLDPTATGLPAGASVRFRERLARGRPATGKAGDRRDDHA